jgi:hypothetical protein
MIANVRHNDSFVVMPALSTSISNKRLSGRPVVSLRFRPGTAGQSGRTVVTGRLDGVPRRGFPETDASTAPRTGRATTRIDPLAEMVARPAVEAAP